MKWISLGWGVVAIIFGFFIGEVFGFSYPSLLLTQYKNINELTSCEGIEDYYTGTDFDVDVWNAEFVDDYEVSNDGFNIMPPKDAGKPGWDCEDISHAIYCLGKEYNITCKIYFRVEYGSEDSHVGVKCLIGDLWMQYN